MSASQCITYRISLKGILRANRVQVIKVLLYINLSILILAEEDSLCYVIIRSKQFSCVPGVRKGGLSGAGIFTCHGKLLVTLHAG